MKRFKFRASWWPPGKDLQTFRLAKFFSLSSFVVILVFTVILTLFLTNRAQRLALKQSEDYTLLLASNLNHQVFQLFLLPTAIGPISTRILCRVTGSWRRSQAPGFTWERKPAQNFPTSASETATRLASVGAASGSWKHQGIRWKVSRF